MTDRQAVQDSYRYCLEVAGTHYENFPVASYLIPKPLRGPVAAIYTFARSADDFADEGDLEPAVRLAKLHAYAQQLDTIKQGGRTDDPVFIALSAAHRQFQLPLDLFYDLLTAFRMDVTKKRYADFNEVMNYCRYSANPVGRLMLQLFDAASEENLRQSDAICSALQLINFLQDMSQDYRENNRIYMPQDEMAYYGIDESWFQQQRSDDAMRIFLGRQIHRAYGMISSGAPLAWRLNGRFGMELRLTVLGGTRILHHLSQQTADVFSRPRLGSKDKLWMLWHAMAHSNMPEINID